MVNKAENFLLVKCLSGKAKNDHNAWNLFFKNYQSFINREMARCAMRYGIEKDFSFHPAGSEGRYPKVYEDFFQEINTELIQMIFPNGIIKKSGEPITYYKKYLVKIIEHLVVEYTRSKNRLKKAAEKHDRENTTSMDSKPNGDKDLTEIIPDRRGAEAESEILDNMSKDTISHMVEEILDAVYSIKNEKLLLVLSSSIMFYHPMPDEIIKTIAERREISAEQVKKEACTIMERLEQKHQEKSGAIMRAANNYAKLKRLKAECFLMEERHTPNQSEMKEQYRRIGKKEQEFDNNLKSINFNIKPTAEEISVLTGIIFNDANQINVILKRVRDSLKKNPVIIKHNERLKHFRKSSNG